MLVACGADAGGPGDVLLLIAAAFALGTALGKTGAAEQIAGTMTRLLAPLGSARPASSLGAPRVHAAHDKCTPLTRRPPRSLYFMTTVLTEVISNAATVSLMFPIAWQFVLSGVLNYKAMCFTLMLAGSSSFCTPVRAQATGGARRAAAHALRARRSATRPT